MKTVVITYCKPCKYEDRAVRAAAAIKEEFGMTAELVPAKGGIFEVAVDGAVVAKRSRGNFPDESAIVAAVAQALSQ